MSGAFGLFPGARLGMHRQYHWCGVSLVPSPSYEKIEKGSGQTGCMGASQRNAIKVCVK